MSLCYVGVLRLSFDYVLNIQSDVIGTSTEHFAGGHATRFITLI